MGGRRILQVPEAIVDRRSEQRGGFYHARVLQASVGPVLTNVPRSTIFGHQSAAGGEFVEFVSRTARGRDFNVTFSNVCQDFPYLVIFYLKIEIGTYLSYLDYVFVT